MSSEKILAEIVVADLTEAGIKPPNAPSQVMSKTASVRFYRSSKKRVSFQHEVVQFDLLLRDD